MCLENDNGSIFEHVSIENMNMNARTIHIEGLFINYAAMVFLSFVAFEESLCFFFMGPRSMDSVAYAEVSL